MATRSRPRTGAPNDDITEWLDEQPAAQVLMDTDDVFPEVSDDEPVPPRMLVPTQPATEERPPDVPSRTDNLLRTVRDKLVSKPTAKKAPAPARARKPAEPRKPIQGLIAGGWRILAGIVEPVNPPVSRTMVMQAPIAGMVLEDVVKDTVLDRILQPLARIEGHGETAFALIGPPLLVGIITADPEHPRNRVLVPMLRQALMSWLEVSEPYIKKQLEREKKFAAEYGTRVDAMMTYLFSGVKDDAADYGYGAESVPGTYQPANGHVPAAAGGAG